MRTPVITLSAKGAFGGAQRMRFRAHLLPKPILEARASTGPKWGATFWKRGCRTHTIRLRSEDLIKHYAIGGTQMESAALNNIAKEFWPDIRHKLLRQK
jgi:hypothetical protein